MITIIFQAGLEIKKRPQTRALQTNDKYHAFPATEAMTCRVSVSGPSLPGLAENPAELHGEAG
jgi:hypothetical protein